MAAQTCFSSFLCVAVVLPLFPLQFFGFLLVVGLIAQLVWALLWYFLKWYKALKSKYEYSAEGAEADYKE